jgi:hypothetical protein
MMKRSLLLALILAFSSCRANREHPAPTSLPTLSASSSNTSGVSSAELAQSALDDLDSRTPVPLLPMMAHHQKQNMRDHLAVVQEVVSALGRKDFSAVEKAVARVGYSDAMGQMCTHMGAGAPGFTEKALAFHHTADKIADAARHRDQSEVASALADTLTACTFCHATYKQQVVDQATWSALTRGTP